MKKLFTSACLFVVIIIWIVTFIAQPVFGQVIKRSIVEKADLPSYIPPSCVGKTITRMSREEMLTDIAPVVKPNPPLTKDFQLQVFNILVNRIAEVYLYPDYRGLNWNDTIAKFRKKVESGLETEQFYTEMGLFIISLGDRHSSFQSPSRVAIEKARLAGDNSFVGIGALSQPMPEKKYTTLLTVYPNSPAAHSGLQPHDIILQVDSLPFVINEKYYTHTRGPECTMATLWVKAPGKEPRTVRVIRARVTGPQLIDARLIPTTDGRRIGYIFLPTFLDLTIDDQVKKALEDFGPLDGLVLDNRMNGGGSSLVVFPLLNFFTWGTLGHFVSRQAERPLVAEATPVHNSQTVPLVVLVSKRSVSFAEIFAGVLRDVGRAKVVGQTSAGRVETLHAYDYPEGSRLWIAQESFRPINSKTNWQGIGIKPDVEVIAEWDEFTFENDPALAAALKIIPRK